MLKDLGKSALLAGAVIGSLSAVVAMMIGFFYLLQWADATFGIVGVLVSILVLLWVMVTLIAFVNRGESW